MIPSVEPNATKGPSPPDDLERNSMLQREERILTIYRAEINGEVERLFEH